MPKVEIGYMNSLLKAVYKIFSEKIKVNFKKNIKYRNIFLKL